MRTVTDRTTLGSELRAWRRAGKSIGFVATMGALHAGHVSLISASRRDNDLTIMSSYVNPSQFAPSEDLALYPRDPARDAELAEQAGLDILFIPSDADIYAGGIDGQMIWVDPGPLGRVLEGAHRPGHFRGVATVVAKLFNMVQPDRAYFGRKDAQQAIVLTRLATDLNYAIDIRIEPTVREDDGLALSSRNVFLTADQRAEAPALYQGLRSAQERFARGEHDAEKLREIVESVISSNAPLSRLQYVSVNHVDTLETVTGRVAEPSLLSLAAYFGSTRLIDNVVLTE